MVGMGITAVHPTTRDRDGTSAADGRDPGLPLARGPDAAIVVRA